MLGATLAAPTTLFKEEANNAKAESHSTFSTFQV